MEKIDQFATENINKLIDSQKMSIKFYLIFTLILFAIGSFIIWTVLRKSSIVNTEAHSAIIAACGAFITVLTAIPIKEMMFKREKIVAYRLVNQHLKILINNKDAINHKDIQRARDLIWKIMENTTVA